MSAFLEQMTPAGRELLAELDAASSGGETARVVDKYAGLAVGAFPDGVGYSNADMFAFFRFMATKVPPRLAASMLDAAGQHALRASAHAEALAVLQHAQRLRPRPGRRESIRLLQRHLAAKALPAPGR